jgi:hypothetical protein
MIATAAAALASTLALGLAGQPGTADHVRAAHATWRYQYLTGGVGTDNGWRGWNPDGTFVSKYVAESRAAGLTPVLTYYQLLPSGHAGGSEAEKDLGNLKDNALMKAYYDDLALALRRAHEASRGKPVVLHVEPDLWGYVEQRAGGSDDPGTIPAAVASTQNPTLAGLPNTAAGFAQAIVALRDALAPEVRLGYHMSTWGTGTDPVLQNPSSGETTRLAKRSATFYTNLHARFDLVFSDPSDRDDGFKAKILGDGGKGRWTAGDYARDRRWLATMHAQTKLPLVVWQIPLGNRRLPNTWTRFRDTHVETLLGRRSTTRAYAKAGVIAFLFGGGAEGTTSERTDGGLFRRLSARYARAGGVRTSR